MILSTLLLGLLLQHPVEAVAAPPELSVRRFVIDAAASEVGFDGTSTLHDFTGRSKEIQGDLRLDVTPAGTALAGLVSVRAASLDTDNRLRDREMRDRLDVENFPQILFRPKRATGELRDDRGLLELRGVFNIHGAPRTRTISTTVEPRPGGGYRVRGDVRFKLSEHGIDPPSFLFVSMDDEVRVWFDLSVVPAPAASLATTCREMELIRRTTPVEGEPRETTVLDRIWTRGDAGLWEAVCASSWILGTKDLVRIDPVPAAILPLPGKAETAFDLERARLDRLRARLARSGEGEAALRAEIAALEAALAAAPAPGPATVLQEGGTTLIRIEGEEWARFDALEGKARFARLLLGIEGIPESVRQKMAALRGVPERFQIRTVTPEETCVLSGSLGGPIAAKTPDWAWAPRAWAVDRATR